MRPGRVFVRLDEAIVDRIRAAGGVAVVLPPGDAAALPILTGLVDGLVVSGGPFDIHPRRYGQAVQARIDGVDDARTDLELALLAWARRARVPALGVCGGMQAMVVEAGGTLHQDVRAVLPGALDHEQPGDPTTPGHPLRWVHPAWEGRLPAAVNSTHHQAADAVGPLRVIARAPDGVVEAVDLPGHPFYVGVQWHPELLGDTLYAALVDAAAAAEGSRR